MIKFLIYTYKLKLAIFKANRLHKLTKRQYYVLKWHGKLKVFSSKQLRYAKKNGQLTKNFNWLKLQELAIYKTAQ